MAADVAPDGEGTGCVLVGIVGAVERPASHTYFPSAIRTPADDRLHQDVAVVGQFQHGRECLALLASEAVQQDAAFLQQYRHLRVRHFAIADDGVDVQYARRAVANVVLTAVPLAGLDHIAAAQGAAADDFLFCFHCCMIMIHYFDDKILIESTFPVGHDAADDVLAGHHICPSFRVKREPEVVPRERAHLPGQDEQVGVDGFEPCHHLVGDVIAFRRVQQVDLMLPILPVSLCHIVAARSHELFHERIECRHLRGRVRQLVRHDGRYRRALEVASH